MNDDLELMATLARKIRAATEHVATEALDPETHLPTAPDLAKALNMKLDRLKKKLKWLKRQGLIRVVGVSPKRYRFDQYTLDKMDPADPFYEAWSLVGVP